jgi:hypothetical protein
LTTGSNAKDNVATCNSQSDSPTEICLDQRKRKIDASRDACRCPDIAVTEVDRLRINIDLGSKSPKALDVAPMSYCSTPIKQACCCEEECASANGHDTGPAPPRRLEESGNLAAFERAAKTRVAACGDQCVGGAAL